MWRSAIGIWRNGTIPTACRTSAARAGVADPGEFSVALATQFSFGAPLYDTPVSETRGIDTRKLLVADNDGSYDLPLYAAYTPVSALHGLHVTPPTHASAIVKGRSLPAVDMRGRCICAQAGTSRPAGVYVERMLTPRGVVMQRTVSTAATMR